MIRGDNKIIYIPKKRTYNESSECTSISPTIYRLFWEYACNTWHTPGQHRPLRSEASLHSLRPTTINHRTSRPLHYIKLFVGTEHTCGSMIRFWEHHSVHRTKATSPLPRSCSCNTTRRNDAPPQRCLPCVLRKCRANTRRASCNEFQPEESLTIGRGSTLNQKLQKAFPLEERATGANRTLLNLKCRAVD